MARNNSSQDRSSKSSFAPFMFGVLTGGLIGAAIALLYAPAEGSEVRHEIGEKFDDITEAINGILNNAKTSAEKMLNEGKERGDRIVEEARERAGDLINDADRTMSSARKRANGHNYTNGSNGHQANGNGGYSEGSSQEDASNEEDEA